MERDRKCHRNSWKQKYYKDCGCLEGRCYYNNGCEGRTWKNKRREAIWARFEEIIKKHKQPKQSTLWDSI